MKARLLPLCFIDSKKLSFKIILALLFFFLPTISLASSSDTTIYLSSIEKNIESGEVKVYYGGGNGSIVRTIKKDGTSVISYLHPDNLGSIVLITKPDKTRENSITYYPYGKETTILPSKTDKLYTSQRKDVSSDLYFYNARYYNPNTSHFISADSAEGPNRYSYVGNNPIMKNDPSGNEGENDEVKIQKLIRVEDYFLPNPRFLFENIILSINRVLSGSNNADNYPFVQKLYIGGDQLQSNQWLSLKNKITKDIEDANQRFDFFKSKEEMSYIQVVNWAIYKNVSIENKKYTEFGDLRGQTYIEKELIGKEFGYNENSTLEKLIKTETSVCFDLTAIEQLYLAENGIMSNFTWAPVYSRGQNHGFLTVNSKSGKEFIVDPMFNIVSSKSDYNKFWEENLNYYPARDVYAPEYNPLDFGYYGL